MPVDLIRRLNRRMSQPEHDVLEALLLASNHSKHESSGRTCRVTPQRDPTAGSSDVRPDVRLDRGLLDQPPHRCFAHAFALAAREHRRRGLPRARTVASELSRRFIHEVNVGVALGSFLDPTREVDFGDPDIKINVILVEVDELAHSKPGVGEQGDDCLVASLEVDGKGVTSPTFAAPNLFVS